MSATDGDIADLSERLEQKAVEVGARDPVTTKARFSDEVELFRIVQTDGDGPGDMGDELGVGVRFPDSGVYVDWNVDAWPDDERLSGPHVSEYDSIDDANTVAQGEIEELEISAGDGTMIPMPEDAQLLYPDEGQAGAAAQDLGMGDAAHAHELDGETWYMPGESHDAFIAAVSSEGEELEACVESVLEDNPDYSESRAYAICNAQMESKADDDAVDQKAEFGVGDPVRWTWDGEPVHGRVAEVRPEQATVSGNTITGDEGEPVYVIDEYDDRVGMLRRENVAKPESSLNESRADLPERRETNYAADSEYDSLTTVVSESDFTPRELDALADDHPDLLMKCAGGEWLSAADPARPVIYKADIPDKYLDERDADFFVPNDGMADAARKVEEWEDEHGDDVAGGASDGEGARRRAQIIEHHDRGEPLAIEYWEEILNYHNRHRAQDNHELDAEHDGTPWEDAGYVSDHNWGSDAGLEQAERVMDVVEDVEQEAAVTLEGAVATEQRVAPDAITEADTNKVDLEALEGELSEAVEADDFYIYGKASIEQWDADDPPTYIQMDALEGALDRFMDSEHSPGIISRHHQDIPVGTPVREFEFESDTTLEIDGDTYEFEAGDTATSHVEDADGDGRPELWLAANIGNDTEMGKKTRILSAQGDLNGFSVTVHRNEDEMTSEGRMVTECDLHAVTIGTDEQIKNKGSEYDVASFKGPVRRVKDVISGLLG